MFCIKFRPSVALVSHNNCLFLSFSITELLTDTMSAPPPPPPPPPCAPPPPKIGGSKKPASNTSKPIDRSVLLGEIHKGAKLRKAVTNDRSAPAVGEYKLFTCARVYN